MPNLVALSQQLVASLVRRDTLGSQHRADVLMVAVRWYLRYGLSYRDAEELVTERGVVVDHVTVYRWVPRFTPLLIDAARPCRHTPGDRWFVDQDVRQSGRTLGLYRAIDQFGQVIDILVAEKRDLAVTRRFFTQTLEHSPCPAEVSTGLPRIRECLMSCCLPPATSPSSTRPTRSKPIMAV